MPVGVLAESICRQMKHPEFMWDYLTRACPFPAIEYGKNLPCAPMACAESGRHALPLSDAPQIIFRSFKQQSRP